MLEAIANTPNTTDETRIVVRILSGNVNIVNIKVPLKNINIQKKNTIVFR